MIKQKFTRLLIFTISLTSLNAQNEVNKTDISGKRHGVWQKFYPKTKQLRYQGKFLYGKEIDTFKYYKLKNKKSVLSAIKVFNSENNEAEVTFLSSKGKVISKGRMNGKKFIGEWIFYHKKTNDIMIQENYNANGEMEGKRNVYFDNGALAEEADYKKGLKNGTLKIYSQKQVLLQESNYIDDKLNGTTVYYDINGNMEAKGTFTNNLKTGVWDYYKNKNLVRKIDHDNNKVLLKKQ